MEKKILRLLPLGIVAIVLLYYVVHHSNENNEKLVLKDEWKSLFQHMSDFESASSVPYITTDSMKFEGARSAHLKKETEFGPTFQFDSLPIIKQAMKVDIDCKMFSTSMLNSVQFVLSIENNNGAVLWKSASLGGNVKLGEWFTAHASIFIDPKLSAASTSSVLKVYVLTTKNEEIFVDNFNVNILAQ